MGLSAGAIGAITSIASAVISTATTAVTTAVTASQMESQAEYQSKMAQYQARRRANQLEHQANMRKEEAHMERRKKKEVQKAAAQKEMKQRERQRRLMAEQEARVASQGLSMTGSPLEVLGDTAIKGEEKALRIRRQGELAWQQHAHKEHSLLTQAENELRTANAVREFGKQKGDYIEASASKAITNKWLGASLSMTTEMVSGTYKSLQASNSFTNQTQEIGNKKVESVENQVPEYKDLSIQGNSPFASNRGRQRSELSDMDETESSNNDESWLGNWSPY